MKDFLQWLAENAKRTSLGKYPPSYGPAELHPPQDSMTHAADAGVKMKQNHPDMLKKKKKKKKKD